MPGSIGGRSSKGLRPHSPGRTPGPSDTVVMVIMIVPELLFPDASGGWRFSGAVLPARSTGVGGFEASISAAVPPGLADPANKIIAKSEAKHRKRSVFMSATIIPQLPLDNHNPHLIFFFYGF
jgi:hypothetical protein